MERTPVFYHFIIDDIFIPDSIRCFLDAKLTDNRFFFITENPNYELKFYHNKIELLNLSETINIINNIESYDVIILHSLYSLPLNVIVQIDPKIKVIWYAWGFDLYNNPLPGWPLIKLNNDLLPLTKKLMRKVFFKENVLNRTKHIIKKLIRPGYSPDSLRKALARIDCFAGVFSEEYDLLKNKYPYFKAKRLTHNYIHPEEFNITDLNNQVDITGNNILLGNSALYLVNHLDILQVLKEKLDSASMPFNIICPLSYAGREAYVKEVIKEGKRLFGAKFIALTEFLPFNEYQKVVKSCNVIILGQIRQAATCNCLSSIWNGLRLFVYDTSMNYKHYNNEGLKVYPISSISCEDIKKQRTFNDVLKDRNIIESHYSYRQWVEDLKNSIKIMGL